MEVKAVRLTDKTGRVLEIKMQMWDEERPGYTPDFSQDFFESGNLPYNVDLDAYEVDDIAYCLDQALDWEKAEGDFYEDRFFDDEQSPVKIENRCVTYEIKEID